MMREVLSKTRKALASVMLVAVVCQMSLLVLPGQALAAAPVVATGNISIVSAGSGTSGTFIVGDTVTGQFDDSANPLPAATSANIDFSQFGGGVVAAVETAPGSRIWQASYPVISGSTVSTTADILVSATNGDGSTGYIEDTENHRVDNQLPTIVSAQTLSTTSVRVTFSEDLKGSTVNSSGNEFSLSGGHTITGADETSAGIVALTINGATPVGVNETPTLSSTGTFNIQDSAGNAITTFTAFAVQDGITPATPIITSPVAPVLIDAATYAIDGSAEIGTTVKIYNDDENDGSIAGDAVVASDTAAPAFTIAAPLTQDTANNFLVTSTDGAGNESSPADVSTITEDSTAPTSTVSTAGSFGPNTWPGEINGTAGDTSGIASVSVEIRDPDGWYWEGTGWQATPTTVVATGTDAWSYSILASDLTLEGSYVILSRAIDTAGNIESTGVGTFTWDATAPDSDPSDFSSIPDVDVSTSTDTIQVSWLASASDALSGVDGYGYSFTQGETDIPDEIKLIEETANSVTSPELSPDGAWYFHISTVDNAGNWTSTAHYGPFIIDTTEPPAPTIDPVSTPVDDSSQTVTGTAEANSIITVSGGASTVQNSADGIGNYSVDVPLTQNATNNLSVTATDAAGNESSAENATILEDSTDPEVTLSSPNGGETYAAGSTQNITWTATDANLATNPIELQYSTDNFSSTNVIATNEDNDGSYTWTIPGALHSDTVKIRVIAIDQVGHSGSDDSDANFTVDNTLPASAVTTSGSYGPNTWGGVVNGTATDPSGYGVAEVRVAITSPSGNIWTGVDWQTAPAPDFVVATDTDSWSVPLTVAQITEGEGTYSIISKAVDTAGNIESTGVGSFVWDTTSPSITMGTSPDGQEFETGDTLVFAGTTEAGAGVKLEIFSDVIVLQTVADSFGQWEFRVSASKIGVGSHRARVTATDAAGNSLVLENINFKIFAPVVDTTVVSRASSEPVVLAEAPAPESAPSPAAVQPRNLKPTVTAEAPETSIKAAEDTADEGSNTWQTIITIIAIIIIALGVGTAGYYAYEWWATKGEGDVGGDSWDNDKSVVLAKKTAKKGSKRKKSSRRGGSSRSAGSRW